jgi:CP family cyanate transporter-like MFS transporter
VTRRSVATATRNGVGGYFVGLALLLLGLNLRLSVASVPPVLDQLRQTLGLSATAAGVLTMLPVLCMGAFAPVAPRAARRIGEDATLLAAVALLAGGIAVRLVPSSAGLFAGTLVTGIAIAVLNVVLPAVIKREFVRPGTMMGLYTTMLTGGAALAAGLTVPFTHLFSGASWRPAMALWAVPALLGAVAWGAVMARQPRKGVPLQSQVTGVAHSPWRSPLAWRITAYMGTQSLLFYAFLSWAPDILRDAGLSTAAAGGLLSVALLCGIPASMSSPIVAERTGRAGPSAGLAALCWIGGLLGLLVAPGTASALWMVLIGLGQGGAIALALTLIVIRSPDRSFAAGLSGMAQTVGYLLAALGPLLVGVLHSTTGDWGLPLLLMLIGAGATWTLGTLVDRSPNPAAVPARR